MTGKQNDGPQQVRLMTDGGTDPRTVTRTAVADGVVTREVDGDEQDMLRVPISSTRSDRENDEFAKEALEGMADQIRAENPMVFDNHGLAGGSWMDAIPYDARETIGAQMDAELESAEDGEWDLYALVNPDGTHPEGERLLGQVRDEGQPVKFSVGFKIINSDEKTDDAGNEIGRVFTMADLMETSRVGIPANPDASVNQSMSAKGGDALPGVQNHPVFQMMEAMGHGGTERDTAGQAVTKDGTQRDTATDGGDPDAVSDLADAVESLRSEVADLRAEIKEEGDPCDDNGDCPDGEECVDGECVPVDEEESSAGTPEVVQELREENAELREEVESIRESIAEGRGDSKSGDTTVTQNAPEPEETEDDDDDSTEEKTAMDLARGS